MSLCRRTVEDCLLLDIVGGGGGICSYCTRYAVVYAATAFPSPPFQIRQLVAGDDVAQGTGQGVVPGRRPEKHMTHPQPVESA